MKVGQTVRVIKRKEGKNTNAIKINNRLGILYALDKHKITVEYTKDGQPTFRESYNQADIIENIVSIEVEEDKGWKKVTKEYFKK